MLQIASDALLDLRHAPLHLGPREVLVAVVHRLELAAVNRDAGLRQQAYRAAQCDKLRTHFVDSTAIVLAEVGNRLVIGCKPARQPHHLNVAPGLVLKPPARLHPIEIAVNVKLQQHGGMIRRPPRYLGSDPVKSQRRQIEFIDKNIDHANRIVLADPVFQALRKQRRLLASCTFDEPPHPILPQIARKSYARINRSDAFLHMG